MELKQMAHCILEIASKHYCHMVEGPLDPSKLACNVNNDLGKRPETLKNAQGSLMQPTLFKFRS